VLAQHPVIGNTGSPLEVRRFIVDNYDCGANLGTWHVCGAVAQLCRRPGRHRRGNGGYLKDYKYDDRLFTAEPPYVLNPLWARWSVSRQTECDVAASG
jgi:hypothetical protein